MEPTNLAQNTQSEAAVSKKPKGKIIFLGIALCLIIFNIIILLQNESFTEVSGTIKVIATIITIVLVFLSLLAAPFYLYSKFKKKEVSKTVAVTGSIVAGISTLGLIWVGIILITAVTVIINFFNNLVAGIIHF